MIYKHFYITILIKLLILIALVITITYLFFVSQSYIWCATIAILIIISIVNLLRYFNNINNWISFFLLGIENEDSSLKVPKKSGNKAIDDVYKGIDRLKDLFLKAKIEISSQEHHYKSVINQSATGLFSVNEKGRVININPTAIKLTGLQEYHHINILKKIDSTLPDFILRPRNNKNMQSVVFENEYGQKLLFKLSEIITNKEKVKLIAVGDITKELDNGEVDAWIKLARTLSHEIMNNIAPITTLSKVISGYFKKDEKPVEIRDINEKTILNTIKGLHVIEERSIGLTKFVENYRKFTKLPAPELKQVNISEIIENNIIAALAYTDNSKIEIIKKIPDNVFMETDSKLLSQVIINLVKNACEALNIANLTNPVINIKLQKNVSTRIEISNNGPGIPNEIKEQIFIPFYTTKEEGSGVGLSLSKQIMLKMGGDVTLTSSKNDNTSFSIVLN
jgi:nitrogen fixation/metabolism regulation signal transduction histidine kinase